MPVRFYLFLTFALIFSEIVIAGKNGNVNTYPGFGVNSNADTLANNFPQADSIPADSAGFIGSQEADSLSLDSIPPQVKRRSSPLEDEVKYSSRDSMLILLQEKKLYLYGDAKVTYQNIELVAEYIELDLGNEEVFAKGIPDTNGNVIGMPNFKQDNQNFESDSMRYNFSSESGIIYHIITQEGEGYLHGDKIKRHANHHIHLEDGKYTTCESVHPHFYLSLERAIVVPEDKIVTGYAYMVVADVPIKFVGIPFGFFPSTSQRASGILMPTWGEEESRGFFLRDFGWYQVLGEYADYTLTGDYYQRGSWAVRNRLAYKWRYHFSGNLAFNYAKYKDNENPDPAHEKGSYSLIWSHRQDPKANPTQNFSASVNFSSKDFDQNYSYNSSRYLSSVTNSSVSYTKRWPSTPFNLSLSANANQNKQTETIDLSLPTGSFNMSTIYPFRGKSGGGKYKWYENIGLTYSSNFKNELHSYYDVIAQRETWDSLQSGFKHSFPLAVNFKLGKLITISPSLSYTGHVYNRHKIIDNIVEYDSITGKYIENETYVDGIKYEQAINPNLGISMTPKLYGMFISKKEDGYVEALRHVLSPSVSASYTPDMSKINNVSYYDTLYRYNENDSLVYYRQYNIYEDEIYSSPPSSAKENASMRFALNNNLEMKVRPKNDTTGESKKVTLLENLNFGTAYYPFKEEYKWNDVSLTGRTSFFDRKLSVSARGAFSPYGLDSLGRKMNEFYIDQENGKLLRFTSMNVNISFTLRSGQNKDEDKEVDTEVDQNQDLLYNDYMEGDIDYQRTPQLGNYVDFEVPWSLSVQHSWALSKQGFDRNISHTVNLSGDVSLTPKWKIGGRTNYDIEQRKMSFTSINIFRDLHCWEMRFTVVPFGQRRSYSFTIQAKGSLLRDLKYEKKPNWYDNF